MFAPLQPKDAIQKMVKFDVFVELIHVIEGLNEIIGG
jgi:hypothetical protein